MRQTVLIIAMFFGIFVLVFGATWVSSCKQADVFNRMYGTTFSCDDFFWAQNQINTNTWTIRSVQPEIQK